jgi:hypothetical protein
MNPLAFTQPVRRVLTLISALALIALSVACGSGHSNPATNPVGFSTSSLSGTYVFTSQGYDSLQGLPLNIAGVLVADGKGSLTSGNIDIVGSDISEPSTISQPLTGSYSVSSDGRGKATLKSSYGTVGLDFVLTSSSHGLVTEFDGSGGGSGTLDLQSTPITSLSQLAGPFAFSVAGADGNDNSFATEGAFTLGSTGSSTAGVEDFNDAANIIPNVPLTAAATTGSGTGPGTLTLSTANFALTFDYYAIDATHLKLIETDLNQTLAGDVFTQTGATIPTGASVFSMSGGVSTPLADAGFLNYDGNTFTGTEDVNNSTTVLSQLPFTGIPSSGGAVGGRLVVNLTGFDPATQWILYPSSGGVLMLETDSLNVSIGAAYTQQSGAALASSQAYGMNLSAFNNTNDYAEDDIAQFTTASNAFTGVVDINDNYGNSNALASQTFAGSYTLDTPSTGRGEATTTANGGAYVNFNFYAVTASQFLILETDGSQVGAGVLQSQTAPSGSVSQSRALLVHPIVRPHGALKRK